MNQRLAIGIDLGGTNLRIALVNRDGLIHTRSDQLTQADRGPDAVIVDIAASVNALIDGASLDRRNIAGIGLCTPGPLALGEGRIIHAANLPRWKNVPIRKALAEELHLPVILENDGNAAAFGEYCFGAGRGCEDMVMLTLGTGVGAGVILNGNILHGHFDNAAELGHMIVVTDGLPCPCGQRGCLEQYASAGAIVRRVFNAHPNPERMRRDLPLCAEAVAQNAANGDPLCQRIWDEACLYLAIACVNIQHTYNPAKIVLGGGLSNTGAQLLDRVNAHFRKHTWSLHTDAPEIVLAQLGGDAGLVGAAKLAMPRDT